MLALAAAIHLNIGGLVPRNGSVLVLVTRYSTLLLSISDAHVVHLGQMSQNNHKHPSLWTREDWNLALLNMLAGSLARMCGAVTMSPADTIKTRLQFQGGLPGVRRYLNGRDALVTIWREEGCLGFTRGLPARLIYVAPSAGVSFFFYETIVAQVRTPQAKEPTIVIQTKYPWMTGALSFLGLASARVLGSAIRTPFDIVKQRMQIQGSLRKQHYKNTFEASYQIAKVEGFGSLFSTAHAAVIRDAPFAALYYSAYEMMKDVQRWLFGIPREEKLSRANNFIGGGIAGAFASICTNPMDVVKTRIQTQASLPKDQWRYKGVLDAVVKIAREEGLRGFTVGLLPRIMYITPSAAIIWTCYEAFKDILHRSFAGSIPHYSD